MLRYKGVEFTRLDLPNMTHKFDAAADALPRLDRAGDDASTASACPGTMKIARALEALRPEPPLFPAEDRATVEGAEAWADSVLQDGVRQLAPLRRR